MHSEYNDVTSKLTKELLEALRKEICRENYLGVEYLSKTIRILVEQGVWNTSIGE